MMSKKEIFTFFGLLSFVLCLIFGRHLYRKYNLLKTKKTYAIYVEKNVGVGITQKYFLFSLENGKKQKSSALFSQELDIGDTVWINYSIENPNVIEVIDIFP